MTPWTVPSQAPLSMGFSGKNTGVGGLPFLSPGDLSDPCIEIASPALQVDALLLSHQILPMVELADKNFKAITQICSRT